MSTALGYLRYDPQIPGLRSSGGWMILACDPDWYRMCLREAEQRIPGQWMHVVDADRVFSENYPGRPASPVLRKYKKGGAYTEHQALSPHEIPQVFVDYTPHLGVVRPRFEPPAWGPHISIARGERPRKNRNVWDDQARVGEAALHLAHLRAAHHNAVQKAKGFAETLESGRPKDRDRQAITLADMRRQAENLVRQIHQAERAYERCRDQRCGPEWLREEAEVRFEFESDLCVSRSHWYLRVRCPQVVEIRRFYGLSDYPRVPLHLTVGVTEGG